MAIPILRMWRRYFLEDRNEGLGSSYERVLLNRKLQELIQRYQIRSALEVPIFGFTGLSGINSMWLANNGIEVHLVDNNEARIDLIRKVWDEINLRVNLLYQVTFETLPFASKSVDFSWNYSALWFVGNLQEFARELTRVVKRAIMFCVPNRSGFGYLSQKYFSGSDLREEIREDFIIPRNIIACMNACGWTLIESDYIDCPPWPDIGMARDEFLRKLGLSMLSKKKRSRTPFYSILNYYSGRQEDFDERMMKFSWFERRAPKFIKFFWAHHKYLIFEPKK